MPYHKQFDYSIWISTQIHFQIEFGKQEIKFHFSCNFNQLNGKSMWWKKNLACNSISCTYNYFLWNNLWRYLTKFPHTQQHQPK